MNESVFGVDQHLAPPLKPMVRVCVCICTFQRPQMLAKLLHAIEAQETEGRLTISVSVADNDVRRSAESVVADFSKVSSLEVMYACEPRMNIALARNTALRAASGDYLAFIDDDEVPVARWLLTMIETCEQFCVAGVLGPVRPHFDETPPAWIIDGGFFQRPEPLTGTILKWEECRTGNVLLRSEIVDGVEFVFDPQFGSGGEDKDFFMRMIALNHVFCWCGDGAVYETVPKSRWTRGYLLKRALLRGQNILKHPEGRTKLIVKSMVAAPIYLVALPFALLLGQHVVMKFAIKFCDHAGRLAALCGVNPVRER